MNNEDIGEVLNCIDDLLTEANAFNKVVDKQRADTAEIAKRLEEIRNKGKSHKLTDEELKEYDKLRDDYHKREKKRGIANSDANNFIDNQTKELKGHAKGPDSKPVPDIAYGSANRRLKQKWMYAHGDKLDLDSRLPNFDLTPNRYLFKQYKKIDNQILADPKLSDADFKTRNAFTISKSIADASKKEKNPVSKFIMKHGAKKLDNLGNKIMEPHKEILTKRDKLKDELAKPRKESVDDEALRTIDEFLTEANAFNRVVDKQAKAWDEHHKDFLDKREKEKTGKWTADDEKAYEDRKQKYLDNIEKADIDGKDAYYFKKNEEDMYRPLNDAEREARRNWLPNKATKQFWMKWHGNKSDPNNKLANDKLKPNRYLNKQIDKVRDKVNANFDKSSEIGSKADNLIRKANKTNNPIAKLIYKKGTGKIDKLSVDELDKGAADNKRLSELEMELINNKQRLAKIKPRKESVDDETLRTIDEFLTEAEKPLDRETIDRITNEQKRLWNKLSDFKNYNGDHSKYTEDAIKYGENIAQYGITGDGQIGTTTGPNKTMTSTDPSKFAAEKNTLRLNAKGMDTKNPVSKFILRKGAEKLDKLASSDKGAKKEG